MVYEKLAKLRAELQKAKDKRAEADLRVKQLEQRLKEAEGRQILTDVSALNLSPEQVAEFLQLLSSGKLPQLSVGALQVVSQDSYETDKNEEREDFDDEEFEDE